MVKLSKRTIFEALFLVLCIYACASPATDYIRAEDSAWAEFDPYLDRWIDQEKAFSDEKKEALHLLNLARKARVSHAIAAIGS